MAGLKIKHDLSHLKGRINEWTTKIAEDVLENVGGKENISSATHCITRLRLILKDKSKANMEMLEEIEGAKGVLFNSGQLQVIFGTGIIEKVYKEFVELTGAKEVSVSEMKDEGVNNSGNRLQRAFKSFLGYLYSDHSSFYWGSNGFRNSFVDYHSWNVWNGWLIR